MTTEDVPKNLYQDYPCKVFLKKNTHINTVDTNDSVYILTVKVFLKFLIRWHILLICYVIKHIIS